MLNGQREMLPLITGDLMVRKASSSFLVVQTFGAQLMWYLDGPLLFITLQPAFAHKVTARTPTLHLHEFKQIRKRYILASGSRLVRHSDVDSTR